MPRIPALLHTPRRGALVATLLAAALYLPSAAGRAILDVDEALYVEAGRQMSVGGDWVTPRVNGVCFLDPRMSRRSSLVFAAALAGAVLSKGLLGLLLPLAIAAAFLALSGGLARLRSRHLWLGAALFLGLVLPWHLLAWARNPGFLE